MSQCSRTHDQVVAIALRPVIDEVFQSQQRLLNAPQVVLRLELASEYIAWFPARLRQILNALISNSVKFRDMEKGETRVTLQLRLSSSAYELRVSDNGTGIRSADCEEPIETCRRLPPQSEGDVGVGVAVVKLLVEQSGGSLAIVSSEGQGTSIVVVLPRFDVDDFLESAAESSSVPFIHSP